MTLTDTRDCEQAFKEALGAAVVHVWAELPESVQEKLFEHAVVAGHRSEQNESLREELARFLHDHHARTAHADKP
jgi:glucose-6-phosphate-specific signal transduction histidine kinase